ncbi:MAG: polysaccharide biosynthesis/export family protein [Pseudomonadota bacterium]
MTRLPIPDATTSITPADLRIGPMDSLDISVFGVSDLDGTYQVDFEGLLKMPLIGEVPAVGKTAGELSVILEQKYEESFLQDPDVNVIIVDSVGRRITVDGSINNPGLYPVTGSMTLLQSVALAGGPSTGANPKKVVVFRQINGERHAAAFDLVAIRSGEAEDPTIFGNDIIVVDGSEARATYGEVLRSLPLIALFMAF